MLDYTTSSSIGLVGTGNQDIGGSQPIYAYTLWVNNTSELEHAINLNSTLEVENQIDFTEGIVSTLADDAVLNLSSTATTINTNDTSFVDGFVRKEGVVSFEFPVGDSAYYRYAAINIPESSGSVYRVRYLYEDPENLYPATSVLGTLPLINPVEYWIVENTLGAEEEVEITLSWNEDTATPAEVVDNAEDLLRMVRWNEEHDAWVEIRATVDADNRTITSTQTIEDTAIFTFGRLSEDGVLPDDVVVWNAVSTNPDGKNDYFRIEGITDLPNNTLEIFNRYGVRVFKTSNYDTNGNVFKGFANNIVSTHLPSGTYFYVLQYDANSGERVGKSGFIFLASD